MPLSSVQRRVDRTLRLYRALLVLIGGLPAARRRELDDKIASITGFTNRVLSQMEAEAESAIGEMRQDLGFLAPDDEYIRLVEKAMQNPSDLFFLPKEFIRTHLFKNYERVSPRWNLHPPHSRFGIDARGELAFTGRTVEWRLLEAALFEDLAMIWNDSLAAETDGKRGVEGDARIALKRFLALKRSTARALFALLEGYLNGIAVNIQWTTDIAQLPADQREMILEQDDKGRQKFKRLRDKVMQYPKIAIGAAHPPIPENNPQLAVILKRERDWRDAVMHPTPRLEEDRTVSRERAVFEIELKELAELIDAAISLIRQIDAMLAGQFGSVSIWLHDRGADGSFPNTVFH